MSELKKQTAQSVDFDTKARLQGLRIMLFIETAGPGGAETVVLSLASELINRGLYVVVLTLSQDRLTEELRKAGVEVIQLESKRRFDLSLPFRIARQIKLHKIQLLHSHLLDSNFYGALAARIAGVPHLASEHGDVHHPHQKLFLQFKLQVASFCGSYFAAVSDYTLQRLQRYGVNRVRLIQMPNPVAAAVKVNAAERERMRKILRPRSTPEEFIWIHVANLRPVKDQKTLIRGFAKSLALSDTPQGLCIVGDGSERQQIETLIEEHMVGDRVTLLGFRSDVTQLLAGADGFILTSRSEALPVSLLEAGAAGLVVISSKVGGIGEIIEEEESGLLFRPGDSDTLAQLIASVIDDRAKGEKLAEKLSSFVERHFLLPQVVDEHLDLYRRLVG